MVSNAVLGVREDRVFETPALTSAHKKAIEYWTKTLEFQPIAIDTQTHAILNKEHKSVSKLYHVIVRMALSRPTDYLRNDGVVMVEEPGGRRWAQRVLAACAEMSVNTARSGLKRLRELDLIKVEAVFGRCTFVLVKGLQRFIQSRWWRLMTDWGARQRKREEKRKKKTSEASDSENKSVSVSDTFPPLPAASRSLTSTVDVTKSVLKGKKEVPSPDARALLAQYKAEELRKN